MSAEPVRYFHRYRGQFEQETVPGEGWLRWLYTTGPGRLALHAVVKRAFLSRWFGRMMDRPSSRRRIAPFIAKHGLDVGEFADDPASYPTFNAFFYRRLRPGARPVHADPEVVVFPADGRHLAFPEVGAADGFYAKGQQFTVAELLADEALGRRFSGGSMVISRLCPVDYHRFHFPLAGRAGEARVVNGALYSVNPIALRAKVRRLVENKRAVTLLEDTVAGAVAIVEIGATMVGSILQTYRPGPVAKGEEKGCFAFGGSCVISLFERGRVRFDADLVERSRAHQETFARMGDRLGTVA